LQRKFWQPVADNPFKITDAPLHKLRRLSLSSLMTHKQHCCIVPNHVKRLTENGHWAQNVCFSFL